MTIEPAAGTASRLNFAKVAPRAFKAVPALDTAARDHELAQLIAVIITANAMNRIAISTGKLAGTDERGAGR